MNHTLIIQVYAQSATHHAKIVYQMLIVQAA